MIKIDIKIKDDKYLGMVGVHKTCINLNMKRLFMNN
jgi:hypothetical protein